MHEASIPKDSVCDCCSAPRLDTGSGWLCTECARKCTITGRLSVSEPATIDEHLRPNLKPLSQQDKAFLADFDWGTIEDAYLQAYSQADIRNALADPFGVFGTPGADPYPADEDTCTD